MLLMHLYIRYIYVCLGSQHVANLGHASMREEVTKTPLHIHTYMYKKTTLVKQKEKNCPRVCLECAIKCKLCWAGAGAWHARVTTHKNEILRKYFSRGFVFRAFPRDNGLFA